MSEATTTDPTERLDTLLPHLWTLLGQGASSSRYEFHLPGLATISPAGVPELRTVVLRVADPSCRRLICHTDLRSAKVEAVRAHPNVAWLFYDHPARTQVRVTGQAMIHHDDPLADERWAASPNMSRRCYLAPFAPGTITEQPERNLPPDVIDAEPSTARTEDARQNFAVLSCTVHQIDWLHLAHDGHRRARFTWDDRHGDWTSHWIAV